MSEMTPVVSKVISCEFLGTQYQFCTAGQDCDIYHMKLEVDSLMEHRYGAEFGK